MQKQAVIDVGTNSIKMLVAHKCASGDCKILFDRSLVVRLGEGVVSTGLLSEEAMQRSAEAFSFFVQEGRKLGVVDFYAVGTQALRIAQNSREFIDRVKKETGVEIRVISGDEEAQLSYRAAISRVGATEGVQLVFDVGGGSTELIEGRGGMSLRKVSIPIGALSLHDAFFAGVDRPDAAQLAVAREYVAEALKVVSEIADDVSADAPLIGIGGTLTTIARVILKTDRTEAPSLQGRLLRLDEVNQTIALFSSMSLAERKRIPGLEEKRAEIILAGACLVAGFLEFMHRDSLVISDRGLRYGVFEFLSEQSSPF
ncbi:MAG: Ppx/GppA family phosphatase [Synergistaceae bacterium]|nr:Ppx/GppA family phosphatase [Synergistaceae bacterium]